VLQIHPKTNRVVIFPVKQNPGNGLNCQEPWNLENIEKLKH
jgi:hypothetical protein